MIGKACTLRCGSFPESILFSCGWISPAVLNELALICRIDVREADDSIDFIVISTIDPKYVNKQLRSKTLKTVRIHGKSIAREVKSEGEARVIADEGRGVVYEISDRKIGLFYRDSSLESQLDCLKVVRSVVEFHLEKRGFLKTHVAAVRNRVGRTICIAGPKHSGKTTLLLSMLREGNFSFVTNDKAHLLLSSSGLLQIVGSPTLVSVRRRTLASLPELQTKVVFSRGEKSYLYSSDICDTYGVNRVGTGSVDLVLTTSFNPKAVDTKLSPVAAKLRSEILDNEVAEFSDNITTDWMFNLPPRPRDPIIALKRLPWHMISGNYLKSSRLAELVDPLL